MTIAIPVSDGKLSSHFGHCESFGLFQVENGGVLEHTDISSPAHEPGLLPRWLRDKGVDLVIAGGMGPRAQELFTDSGVKVICGVQPQDPATIVQQYLKGQLETGDNACHH